MKSTNTTKKSKKEKLSIGMQAPDFTLLDNSGKEFTLSDYRGKPILLYFFPKAETPGCTQQACSFRDAYTNYSQAGIIIVGVSYDSVEDLQKFKKNHNLPFILLSDYKNDIAHMYGADDGFFNKIFKFPKRISFLIDTDGTIIDIIQNISLPEYAEIALARFKDKRPYS